MGIISLSGRLSTILFYCFLLFMRESKSFQIESPSSVAGNYTSEFITFGQPQRLSLPSVTGYTYLLDENIG